MTQTDRKKSEQTLDDLDQCDSKDFALVDIGDVDIGDVDIGDVDIGDVDIGDVDIGDVDIGDVDIGDVDIGDVVVLDKSEHEETNKSVAKNEYCLYCCSILNRSGQCSLCGDDSSSKVLEFHPLYLPPGEILAGTYLVGRVLGHGGFGITYLGVDANLGIRVAIKEYIPRDLASRDTITNHVIAYSQKEKQIFEDNLERFLQEGKMLGRLSHHPNVIPAIRFFKENNTGYLVMPYIEGETLEQIREAQGGTIPLETLLPYMIELLKGLSSLHKQNILHRDIKPPNLYLTQTGQLKILDFGSARLVGNKKQRPLTKEGTPSFAAPEQNDALGEQGAWTDVFGVGATFYVLLTGHIPVDPLYRAGGYMRLPSPAQISPDLIPSTISEIIMKSLELDPQKRFQSAQEFLEQLILSQQDLRKSFMPLPSHVPNHLPSFLSQEHLVQIDSDAKEASSRADNVSESVFFVEDQENDGLLFPDTVIQRKDEKIFFHFLENQNLNDDKKKNTEDHIDFYTEDDLTVNNQNVEEYFNPNDFFSHRKKMFYWLMFGTFLLACLGAVYWFFPNATPKPKMAFFPIRVIALQSDKMVSRAIVEINGKIFGETDLFGQFVVVLRGSVDEIVSFRIVSEKADNIVEAKKKLRVKKTPNGWLPLEVRLFAAFHPRPKLATSLPSNKRCPEGMAWIAAGAFPMGSAVSDVMRSFGEKALVRTSTAGFCIDRYEAPGKGEMPIRNISWNDAKAHCATKGKRLCSENEWEHACKGSSERRFPYGNTFQPNRCNTRDAKDHNRSVRRGGSMPQCKSPFGVFDLSGNVAEWTTSPFLHKGWRVVRGGSFARPDWDVRCASRSGLPPNSRKPNVGFRCCSSPH